MLLTRFGNKRKMADRLGGLFPTHKTRIDPFFGAGGAFFYLPKPKYAILNDIDDDVINLFHMVKTNRNELEKQIMLMPINESLVKYWKNHNEAEPIWQAIRFLLLSNFTYLGKGDTLRLGLDNTKKNIIKAIEPTFLALQNAQISCGDFRDVIGKISFSKTVNAKAESFVYFDPVYLDTECNYKCPKWTKDDTYDVFEIMDNSGINSGISEFDHPFVIDQAKKRGFNIIDMGVRHNIKNRRREVFITNYDENRQLELG